MKLYEYTILPEKKQWDILWDKGQLVMELNTNDTDYQLYAIDLFFVEVAMDPNTSKVLDRKVFTHGKVLDKYSRIG